MENFDLLVLIFILVNVGAALFKKRRKRQAASPRFVPAQEPVDDKPSEDPEEPDFDDNKRQVLEENVFDILRGWQEGAGPEGVQAASEDVAETPSPSAALSGSSSSRQRDLASAKSTRTLSRPHGIAQNSFRLEIMRLVRNPANLKQAVLLAEILGPPRALKPDG